LRPNERPKCKPDWIEKNNTFSCTKPLASTALTTTATQGIGPVVMPVVRGYVGAAVVGCRSANGISGMACGMRGSVI